MAARARGGGRRAGVAARIPLASLAGVRLYFPDPWPKQKQRHRRLARPDVVTQLVDRLRIGGTFHVATDIADYAAQTLPCAPPSRGCTVAWCRGPTWRPVTRFERRGLASGPQPDRHDLRDGCTDMATATPRLVSARLRVNVCAVGRCGRRLCRSAISSPWQLALLIGWNVAATCSSCWCGSGRDHRLRRGRRREARSTAEDNSRITARSLVMVTASVVSLVGWRFGLAKARQVGSRWRSRSPSSPCCGGALSWCVVHSMFTLRYAHQYYTRPVGGIDFPGTARTRLPRLRLLRVHHRDVVRGQRHRRHRVARPPHRSLRHTLVSYLFGTVIVGLTINVIASFIR